MKKHWAKHKTCSMRHICVGGFLTLMLTTRAHVKITILLKLKRKTAVNWCLGHHNVQKSDTTNSLFKYFHLWFPTIRPSGVIGPYDHLAKIKILVVYFDRVGHC